MTSALSRVVLVVDDEKMITDVLEVLFRRAKLQVRSASTAAQAIELASKEQFGCALIDKNLPDQSGLAVLGEIKKVQPFCGCVIMTGFANYESLMAALRLGALDYLEKPFPDLALLVDKVLKVLERQGFAYDRDQLTAKVTELEAALSLSRAARDAAEKRARELEQELGAVRTPVHLAEPGTSPGRPPEQ